MPALWNKAKDVGPTATRTQVFQTNHATEAEWGYNRDQDKSWCSDHTPLLLDVLAAAPWSHCSCRAAIWRGSTAQKAHDQGTEMMQTCQHISIYSSITITSSRTPTLQHHQCSMSEPTLDLKENLAIDHCYTHDEAYPILPQPLPPPLPISTP
ncbi:hypothetical protein M409DRAFT_60859 [Zasmidium cellare ATCC 36951]|uniref:Uncharacterized protein n=1 Tax=Zasmidium cellare ATCC 36951 TaxID=1080233 RepID=A0A6A6BXR4_ZASCE|nr:uncharacterized protein M409DRAFT_60859 [Zasmidium cellare ATCC 36951]KAF2159393.1 hypothetical protein M409DRAFT_60859 [Zasmidium cellare ATCC 36951]